MEILLQSLIFLFFIPGIFFNSLSLRETCILKKIILCFLLYAAFTIDSFLLQCFFTYGGFIFISIFSIRGIYLFCKNVHFHKEYLIYLLAWPGALLPVTFIDSINYQLRIPRDLFRFGPHAVDGTLDHHATLSLHHFFLSPFGFSDQILSTAAIAFQAACLVVLLIVMKKIIIQHAIAWQLSFLGVPLVFICAQEALLDMSALLIFTILFLSLIKNEMDTKHALAIGLLFTFKMTSFIFIFPVTVYAFLKSSSKLKHITIGVLPILIYGGYQWMTVGLPLFHVTLQFQPGHPFYDMLLLFKQTIDHHFHVPQQNIVAFTKNIFYVINPFLIISFVLLGLQKKWFLLIIFSFTIALWYSLFPQPRFLMYLLPSLFVLASQFELKKSLQIILLISSISFFLWRGIGMPANYILKGMDYISDRSNKKISTPFSSLLKHLNNKSITYIDNNFGWNLPGRAIFSSPIQFAWRYDKPWNIQMKKSGVTHLLIQKDPPENYYLQFEDAPYHLLYKKYENLRINQIDSVIKSCTLIDQNKDYFLYQLNSSY